ncbi:MAG TPA: hypothetical protein DCE04_04910 [Thermoanaerobacter sp.]|nr:MAG: heat shock protein HslVU, ATPase subunit HslU [Thermoanaerobacter thermocopriae]HAA64535.1 hypothetical protein [Thermoanaerobacter sp.]
MFKGTTIIAVRKGDKVSVAGDGQITFGENTILKHGAKKIRRLYNGEVIVGFAGSVADALTLSQKFEEKLEQYDGIIFIDEIDKIASSGYTAGPDVSREGVQRDILPIIEGCTVMTKYGPVKTDHILFIAAGAFNVAKVSDLIPELQGRFPVRVNLKPLTKEDFIRILKEPKNALTKQYQELLRTEGIEVKYTDEAIEAIAEVAYLINQQSEDIGARRLHTVMEKLFEELSFNAPDLKGQQIVITEEYVKEQLKDSLNKYEVNKYIL